MNHVRTYCINPCQMNVIIRITFILSCICIGDDMVLEQLDIGVHEYVLRTSL